MKNRKIIPGLVLILLATALLLSACSSGGKIEGTWKIKEISGSGSEDLKAFLDMGMDMEMTFKDGKVTMKLSYQGESETQDMGSYKTSGDRVTIDGEDATYKVDGDTLTLKDSQMTMKLVKK